MARQLVRKLAVEGYEQALEAMLELSKDTKYLNDRWYESISNDIEDLLDADDSPNSLNVGLQMLENYIKHGGADDRHEFSENAYKLIRIALCKDYETVIKLVKDLYHASKPLTKARQEIIWWEGINIDIKSGTVKADIDILRKLYSDFVKPILIEELKADHNQQI